MNFKFLFFALPFLAMTACSSDDDVSENQGHQQQSSGIPVSIEVSEEPLTDASAAGTRAAITFKETLTNFKFHILAYGHSNIDVTANASRTNAQDAGNRWETNAMWPFGVDIETPCYFYAFANVDYDGEDFSEFSPGTTFTPPTGELDFSIDEYSEAQMDLLVAKQICTQKENQVNNKPVHFQFHHACAALQFSICKTDFLSDYSVRLSKVKLHNIKKHGTYFFDSDYWELDNSTSLEEDTYADYTLASFDSSVEVSVESTSTMLLAKNANDYMFVIPQTVNAWDYKNKPITSNDHLSYYPGAYLEIKCSIVKNGKDYADSGTVYLPFADTWEMSYIHRYKIRMGTNLRDSYGKQIDFTL